jgi:hypothetical protein
MYHSHLFIQEISIKCLQIPCIVLGIDNTESTVKIIVGDRAVLENS